MEVGYKKDLNHNYMVISYPEIKDTQLYCVKMLYNNVIPGVINLELRNIDNRIMYYYDISGKQSLINLFIKTVINFDKVKGLISGIIEAIDKSFEYLLEEDDFVLQPEYIYMDITTGQVSLCYLPGYEQNIKEQLCSLIEYVMNRIDYNDKEAVMLVYDLYAAAREEGYTFAHMKEVLYKNIHNQDAENPQKHEAVQPQPIDSSEGEKQKASISQGKEDFPVMMEKITGETEILVYSIKTYIGTGICIIGGILILILGFMTKIIYNPLGTHINAGKLAALLLIITCVDAYFIKRLWNKKNKIAKIVTKEEYVDPRTDISCNHIYQPNKINKSEDILEKIKRKLTRPENVISNKGIVDKNASARGNNKYNNGISDRANDRANDRAIDGAKDGANIRANNSINYSNNKSNVNVNDSIRLLCEKLPSGNINKTEDDQKYYTRLINSKNVISRHCLLRPVDNITYEDINLNDFPFFIGKLKKNVDYCIDKDVVSRYHAKITKEEGKYYITDLNSTNGTFVNSQQLQTYQAQEINDGVEISLADIKYIFVCQE